jgi:hypothetical protein
MISTYLSPYACEWKKENSDPKKEKEKKNGLNASVIELRSLVLHVIDYENIQTKECKRIVRNSFAS